MTNASTRTAANVRGAADTSCSDGVPGGRGLSALPLLLTLLLLGFSLLPQVRASAGLLGAFLGTGAGLLAWQGLLRLRGSRHAAGFAVACAPIRRQHTIQAGVQLCVYIYWGWYWRDVYHQAPLILAQLVFLYAFDALLSWSRGRPWLLGCGPLPIVLSTNVFIWFRDDWFVLQFGLVALGALGKEFIRWNRDGRRVHIFNPSAFALAATSLALLATGGTGLTHGVDIATTFYRPPHIYLEIFLLGLIVQYVFSTVLITLSTALVLLVLNMAYTAHTGVYWFLDTNIAAAVFLGMHLLVTDPATSPRSNGGKILFGVLYGLGIWILYGALGSLGLPQFYDKLLPIPILNLCVPAIDRLASSDAARRLLRWETLLPARGLNLLAMGCWGALFTGMLATGFVGDEHEGRSLSFWKEASDKGLPDADRKLLQMIRTRVEKDSGMAANALGGVIMEGRILPRDEAVAAHWFERACEQGSQRACVNVARLFVHLGKGASAEGVARAFEHLDARSAESRDGEELLLLAMAVELGEGGRTRDPARAWELYRRACDLGNEPACAALQRPPP